MSAEAGTPLLGDRAWLGRDSPGILGRSPARSFAGLAAVVPLLIFCAHALLFGDWLIDDAGISFAYARNLALGHGLVSQPGVAPVEGFSNPLWTLLIAGLFRLGLFDPSWTPKALGLVLAAAALLVIGHDGSRSGPGGMAALAPLWLSLSTSFVVWSLSGLENPLFALLLAASCAWTRRFVDEPQVPGGELAAGLLAGLIALTRPDGIVLAAAFPLSLGLTSLRRPRWRALAASLLRFAASLWAIVVSYLLFRRAYFGDWVPNTFHAKEKPSLASLLDVAKLQDFLSGIFGGWAWVVVVASMVALGLLSRAGRLAPRHLSLLVHLGLALAAYLMMPADWMGEYRFATGAIVFAYWVVADLFGEAWRTSASPALRVALALVLAAVTADSAVRHAERSADFASYSITPFKRVAAFAGDGYNALAEALGAERPSVLVPDVGGALYYSRLRVYDLVGLCDRTTARTLTRDTAGFHRYVLEEIRPTFIHVHGPWSEWASFHASPLFARDYAPIFEEWTSAESGSGDEPLQGDYVRRDALGAGEDGLARLRRVFLGRGMARARF